MISKPYFVKLVYTQSGYQANKEVYGSFESEKLRQDFVEATLNTAASGGYKVTNVTIEFGEFTSKYSAERIWQYTPVVGGPATTVLAIPHSNVEI